MRTIASVRSALVRRPWIYWFAAAAMAALAGSLVHGHVERLDETRRTWQHMRPVLVAAHDHRGGDEVIARSTELPEAAVPPSAVATIEPSARARQDIAAGEVIVAADVGTGDGPASLAPDGTLTIGVRTFSPMPIDLGSSTWVLAEGIELSNAGTVVARSDDIVFVAVPEADAPAVAAAAHADLATLAFEP